MAGFEDGGNQFIALIDWKNSLAIFGVQDDTIVNIFSQKEFTANKVTDIVVDSQNKVWLCDSQGNYGKIN